MHIAIRIEGVTPLICNRFTDAAAEAASEYPGGRHVPGAAVLEGD